MRRSVVMVLVAALCALAAPRAVRADVASEAALQFELGQELYRQRRYAEALERFVASNRLVPNPGVMFNIAQTYQLLRRPREAYNWYETYLQQELSETDRREATVARDRLLRRVAVVEVETEPAGASLYVGRRDLGSVGTSPRRIAVEPGTVTIIAELDGHHPADQRIDAARAEVVPARLSLRPLTGTVEVTSRPSGATVRVDDEVAGTTPVSLVLPVGRHRVEVRRDGFVPSTREPRVEVDQVHRLDVTLERAASEIAVLTVSGSPAGATVVLDGEEVGQLPLTLGDLEPGSRTLRVELEGHEGWETEIALEPGGATRVDARLVGEGAGSMSWRYGVYGAGVGALLGGVITGALALRARSSFFDADDPSRADLDRQRRLGRTTDVLLGLGLVSVGVTLTFDFVRDRPQSGGQVVIDR